MLEWQVEALDGEGGGGDGEDVDMAAGDERPLKRQKGGGGASGASVPDHHRVQGGTAGVAPPESDMPRRRSSKAGLGAGIREGWARFAADLVVAERAAAAAEGGFAFAFVEGALVKAVREGHWLLLDEVIVSSSAGTCMWLLARSDASPRSDH